MTYRNVRFTAYEYIRFELHNPYSPKPYIETNR
jgi:hypothetical protein